MRSRSFLFGLSFFAAFTNEALSFALPYYYDTTCSIGTTISTYHTNTIYSRVATAEVLVPIASTSEWVVTGASQVTEERIDTTITTSCVTTSTPSTIWVT